MPDPAARQNLGQHIRGDMFRRPFALDDTAGWESTDVGEAWFTVRKKPAAESETTDAGVIGQAKLSTGGIEFTSARAGYAKIASTSSWPVGRLHCDLQLRDVATGEIRTAMLGTFEVVADVTRST